jgi:hypothetical protein
MSSNPSSENQNENQTTSFENINIDAVKAFEKKYNAKLTKDKVIEITYLSKWNLKELITEAMEYAATTERVVRILGIYSLGFGRNVSVSITPKGFIRFSIMLGFRIGLNRPNSIDITVQDIPTLKLMLEQVEKISEELQEM